MDNSEIYQALGAFRTLRMPGQKRPPKNRRALPEETLSRVR